MKLEKTYFDGVSFESYGIVVERVHDPIPDMREDMEQKPIGHGSYFNRLSLDSREITLECRYFGDRWQDFDDMMDELARWLVTEDERELALRSNPGQVYLAHFKSYEEGEREGGKGIGGFELVFTASDPLRYGERRVAITSAVGKRFEVGGTDEADLTVDIRNGRGVAVDDGVIMSLEFSGPDDTYSMSILLNDTSAHEVNIDCVNHVVRADGEVTGLTLMSKWPVLKPGVWDVQFTNGSGVATLSWIQRYR